DTFLYYIIESNLFQYLFKFLRIKALNFVINMIEFEDISTNYVNIGPVNKVLNMVCIYNQFGYKSKQFLYHVSRLPDYLWISEDGMKMQGYNGSQLWDTTFYSYNILSSIKLCNKLIKN